MKTLDCYFRYLTNTSLIVLLAGVIYLHISSSPKPDEIVNEVYVVKPLVSGTRGVRTPTSVYSSTGIQLPPSSLPATLKVIRPTDMISVNGVASGVVPTVMSPITLRHSRTTTVSYDETAGSFSAESSEVTRRNVRSDSHQASNQVTSQLLFPSAMQWRSAPQIEQEEMLMAMAQEPFAVSDMQRISLPPTGGNPTTEDAVPVGEGLLLLLLSIAGYLPIRHFKLIFGKAPIKRKCGKTLIFPLLVALMLNLIPAVHGATYYSRATGNWSATTSWSLTSGGSAASTTPGAEDDVVIERGFAISADLAAGHICRNLTLGSNGTGSLVVGTNSRASSVSITGNVIIGIGSSFIPYNKNQSVDVALSGNLANDGTLQFYYASNGGKSSMVFNGANQVISGSGSFNWFNVTVNAGSSVTLNSSSNQTMNGNLTIDGSIDLKTLTMNYATNAGTLTVNGTMHLEGITGGRTGSSFPLFQTTSLGASSTIRYYSTQAQTVFNTPAYSNLIVAGGGTNITTGVSVNGIFSLEGTASVSGTITYGSAATLQYKGTASRTTTSNELSSTFPGSGGIIINQGTSNIVTLHHIVTNNGDLRVLSGELNLSTYTLNRNSQGGEMAVHNGAILRIGGTGTLPQNYNSHVLGITSTVIYSGTTQTVGIPASSQLYGNLRLSGSEVKSIPTEINTIRGNFSMGGGTFSAARGLSIGGNVSIESGATFVAGNYSHQVAGNWSNQGTFTGTGSTILFNGTGATQLISGTNTFNNLTIATSESGQVSAAGSILTVTGLMRIQSGIYLGASNYNHVQIDEGAAFILSDASLINVSGNWHNNGAFTSGTSTVVLNGTVAQTIGGTVSSSFHHLTMNGTGAKSLGINTTATGTLTMSLGILELNDFRMSVGSCAGGGTSSYIKTNGSGQLRQSHTAMQNKLYPVGRGSYNPIWLRFDSESGTETFRIRVEDELIANSNAPAKTVNRQWYVAKEGAGSSIVTVDMQFNAADANAEVDWDQGVKAGSYSGVFWAYVNANSYINKSGVITVNATGSIGEMAQYPDGFLTIGTSDAFSASKMAVAIDPSKPYLGSPVTVTVSALNINDVPTWVQEPTSIELSAINTLLTGNNEGTFTAKSYQVVIPSVVFSAPNNDGDAQLKVNVIPGGEALSDGYSSMFSVVSGIIYEPKVSGLWSEVAWRKSENGGEAWMDEGVGEGEFVLPDNFEMGELIRVPVGISLTADVTSTFYFMEVYGYLILNENTALTLLHDEEPESYTLKVYGSMINTGGSFTNTDNAQPIQIFGGIYHHLRSGSNVPAALWISSNGDFSKCIIEGENVGGLNQSFQQFTLKSGVHTLDGDMTVRQVLTLEGGVISTTNIHRVIIDTYASITPEPSGYIDGNIRRLVPQNATTLLFPLGDATAYSPLNVTFTGFTGTTFGNGYLDANTALLGARMSPEPPAFASGLSQSKYIQRYWEIENNGVSAYTSFNISMTYNNADAIGDPTESALVVRRLHDGIWSSPPVVGTPADNTVTIGPMTTFSRYYVAEPNCDALSNLWFGSVSSDWHTSANWCNGLVPDATMNVVVHGDALRQPVINQDAVCNSLHIMEGAILNVQNAAVLSILGDWMNEGNFNAGTGTVRFNGNAVQQLTGVTTFHQLTIENTDGANPGVCHGLIANSSLTVISALQMPSGNPSATTGVLHIPGETDFLAMGNSALTLGEGDVTGIIVRNHFAVNTNYTFGNARTHIRFYEVDNQKLPSEIKVRVNIGSIPLDWDIPLAIKRYYSVAQTEASGTSARVQFYYKESEIPEGVDETTLSIWYRLHYPPVFTDSIVDLGWSDYDAELNYINRYDIEVGDLPSSLGIMTIALKETSAEYYTWLGGESTEWNNPRNWLPTGVPHAGSGILIPAAAHTLYVPELPEEARGKYMLLSAGARLTAQTNASLLLYGNGNAWSSEAGAEFIPGNSTVYFKRATGITSISGYVNFYNIDIESGVSLSLSENAYLGILGNFRLLGNLLAANYNNTVEYKGDDTQIIRSYTSGNQGYYNLKLSGNGLKILPSMLHVYGNLINEMPLEMVDVNANNSIVHFNGKQTSTPQYIRGDGFMQFGTLRVNNVSGLILEQSVNVVTAVELPLANPSATRGLLHTGEHTLLMCACAVNTGQGDVTGYIERREFDPGSYHTFGSSQTKLLFVGESFPTSLKAKIMIGAAPSWKPEAIQRVYDFIQEGGENCFATVRTRYLDSELNGNSESALTQWTFGANGQEPDGPFEWGRSNFSREENWVEIVNVDIGLFPTVFGNLENTLAPMSPPTNIWQGSISSDWKTPENWQTDVEGVHTVPTTISKVIIPNAATTLHSPMLPAEAVEIRQIDIESGGVLSAPENEAAVLTINGGNSGAWSNSGTYNPGQSTVVFTNANAVYSGYTLFHHLTFSTGAKVTATDGSHINIRGVATNMGRTGTIGIVTIEYSGGNQTVVVPDVDTRAYRNLILSGSGNKWMPEVPMTIVTSLVIRDDATLVANSSINILGYLNILNNGTFQANAYNHHLAGNMVNNGSFLSAGTFTLNGSSVSQSISGTTSTVFHHLTVDNPMGVNLQQNITVDGLLTLQSNSPGLNTGTITTGNYAMTLGGTTAGVGGVTGLVHRYNLTEGVYSFGNPGNTITLQEGATAERVSFSLSQGQQPAWRNKSIMRTISISAENATGLADFTLHYRESELYKYGESGLVIWEYNASGEIPVITELGRFAGSSVESNYLTLPDCNLSLLPEDINLLQLAMGPSDVNTVVWSGNVSHEWNNAANWSPATVPTEISRVVIPDIEDVYTPVLSGATSILSLTIEEGGVLEGGVGNILTIKGFDEALAIYGYFDPGTSKIVVDNTDTLRMYTSMDLFDFEVKANSKFLINENITLKIGGSFLPAGFVHATKTCNLEFSGEDQIIPVPNIINRRFFDLTLSGSGTKTLPDIPMKILGNLIVNDNVTVLVGESLDVDGSVIISNGSLNVGAYNHVLRSGVSNAGQLIVPMNGRMNISGLVNNSGLLQNAGALQLVRSLTNSGTFHVLTEGSLELHSTLFNHGVFECEEGSSVSMIGTSKQVIDGSMPIVFDELIIDNSAGVELLDSSLVSAEVLKVNEGSRLVIPARKKLTVKSVMNNAGHDGIAIQSSFGAPNASFLFYNDEQNPVQALVEFSTKGNETGGWYNWQFVGIPLSSLSKFDPVLSGSYMRQFHEHTIGTNSPWSPVDQQLVPFKGYMITQAKPRKIVMRGNLVNNNLVHNMQFTNGATYAGLNLLANSYTAAVDIREIGFAGEDAVATVYLFNTGYNQGDQTSGDSPGQYLTVPQFTAGEGGLPRYISSMQGFFVKADGPDATVSFDYSRVGVPNTVLMRTKSVEANQLSYLRFEVNGRHFSDKMWLFAHPECSPAFDNGWDGDKFFGDIRAPQLFARSDGRDYQINASNELHHQQIGFMKGDDDEVYQVKVVHELHGDYVPQQLWLKDLLTDELIDISESGVEFEFEARYNTPDLLRFRVITAQEQTASVNTPSAEKVSIRLQGNVLMLNNMTDEAVSLQVIDMNGNVNNSLKLHGFEARSITFVPKSGVFLLHFFNQSANYVKKIVIL